MRFPAEHVPLFVYGSLRPGMPLWPQIRDFVVEARSGRVRGRLHWHVGGEWPLLLPVTEADAGAAVRGELLLLSPGDAVARVIVDEELVYGYDARWQTVELDDGTVTEALVLVWPRDDEVGAEIPGGDYRGAD